MVKYTNTVNTTKNNEIVASADSSTQQISPESHRPNPQKTSSVLKDAAPAAAGSKKIKKLNRRQLIGGASQDAEHREGMVAHSFQTENLK